ncbi:glycosyltransferase [Gloeobacter kilaueensis]|uniref:Glycosyl transferase group 1 n=1 Tax=Gloeobacter kilaueensis (strain ATCC BAA-2537 / CCAP 1431/1 / ULC 316 / JS1) TaxID=1183438 RepID=U5QMJ5_GLOK1|nr:glycosyltransferase [Gloeobacter kilaueensis]AGY60227.1 glycosyl transferase group 1 [Gloeobacter kilaueensis JS1]
MKILQIIHSAHPAGGGPIEVIRQLGSALVERGHSVEVLCLDAPTAPWLKDFPLSVNALGPGHTGYGYTPRLVPWLRAHRHRYDHVLVNGLWQFTSLGTWLALRGTSTPYSLFVHGMLDPYFNRAYPLKRLKKQLYWPWGEYRVLRDAQAVLFTCKQEEDLAAESFWPYRCQTAIVSLGIRAEAAGPALFYRHFPHLQGGRLVLFLGRLHPKKGCDLLIEAFARVAKTDEALQLVIAGPDPLGWQDSLRQLAVRLEIASRVHWCGPLAGPLKWAALAAAEIFVLPSHQENFGLSIVEALASGLPVLITDKVNIWQEVKEDGAALVAADTLAGATQLLEGWLGLSLEQREQMRSRARECFARRFTIAQSVAALLDALAPSPRLPRL